MVKLSLNIVQIFLWQKNNNIEERKYGSSILSFIKKQAYKPDSV
ncbi:MAG: hypothetical protein CM15mP102_05110 [Flavobacteriales bacterium]|nr:MAG: hypothetical protein CM15mP102_05110 [Flavobacteriales bacterium]